MKQRVGIVRALATSPQVLLMDEPFGALDAQTRTVMQEILTNMWQQFRISVLFVTHDIEESIFLSDRIYVMTARPGRIKAEIVVPLPRPRTPEMIYTPEFIGLVQQLKALIREESLAAMGSEPLARSRLVRWRYRRSSAPPVARGLPLRALPFGNPFRYGGSGCSENSS
jgi:NitT/TauT family transport system ATP-binding protein